ncbi:hypothetical protein QUF80_14205 [Desulfococcaceae bacterium HSG8]|nr:hypothetical protein [Desulfococcaceae bacterium HSG8]
MVGKAIDQDSITAYTILDLPRSDGSYKLALGSGRRAGPDNRLLYEVFPCNVKLKALPSES